MKKLIALFIMIYSYQLAVAQCANSWLRIPNPTSYVSVPGVNVAGTTLTVEARFTKDANVNSAGFPAVDLVSKHDRPSNINYLLRADHAEITVNNVFFSTPIVGCTFLPNRTYHVAMVYNGAALLFYRDGVLLSQVACSGTMFQNSLPTIIGSEISGNTLPTMVGYINEVRIWNIARTAAQINQFRNIPLPTPNLTAGLLAYYTFDNLLNKQGNPAFNATLAGNASVAQFNPSCNLFDACGTCPADSASTRTKCVNQSLALSARAGGTSYSWSPATGLSATNVQNPTTTVNTNTNYIVTITNTATNCTYRDTVRVVVNPAPISNIRDTSVCIGDTVQLVAAGGITYSWSPNYNISGTAVANPKVWPAITTNYIVTITNGFGCSTKDTVRVTANNCHCEDACSWSLTGNSLVKSYYFIGPINNADFKIRTNNTQRMIVTAAGNVGINTTAPAKQLHVNGEARVAVLPAAAPNDRIVFANAQGDLKALAPGLPGQYLSGNGTWQNLLPVARMSTTDNAELIERIEKLEKLVEAYQKDVAQINVELSGTTLQATLAQNSPNPFTDVTRIFYSIPAPFSKAQISITNVSGETVKVIEIKSAGKGQLNIHATDIAKGAYFYSLIVDGKIADTKKFIKE